MRFHYKLLTKDGQSMYFNTLEEIRKIWKKGDYVFMYIMFDGRWSIWNSGYLEEPDFSNKS